MLNLFFLTTFDFRLKTHTHDERCPTSVKQTFSQKRFIGDLFLHFYINQSSRSRWIEVTPKITKQLFISSLYRGSKYCLQLQCGLRFIIISILYTNFRKCSNLCQANAFSCYRSTVLVFNVPIQSILCPSTACYLKADWASLCVLMMFRAATLLLVGVLWSMVLRFFRVRRVDFKQKAWKAIRNCSKINAFSKRIERKEDN